MSKKKTKKLKQKISKSYVLPTLEKKVVEKQNFFSYDLSLIYKDLFKTLIVTALVLSVLLIVLVYT